MPFDCPEIILLEGIILGAPPKKKVNLSNPHITYYCTRLYVTPMVSKLYVCQKDINNKYIERLTLFEGIFERRDVRAEPWMGEVGSRTGLR